MMEIDGGDVLFTITCVSDTSIKYLHIVWGDLSPYFAFCSDEEMKQFVEDNQEWIYNEAFNLVFGKLDNANYYLNIASYEPICHHDWDEYSGQYIKTLIAVYKPLIQMFISDPNTYPKLKEK